jgi:hypothetical protein
LTGALEAPGGALVERARWLIAQQQWEQALAPLSDFSSRYPRSPLAPEAERLTVRARLERALDVADADSDRADRAAALTRLNGISTSSPLFEACAVHIARAILTFNAAPIEGETIMADAMKCWKALDRDASHAAPLGAVEKDVVEIRNVVFRPRGGGFYEGGRFDSYRWEGGPFQVVNPDLRVKLHDRSIRTVRAMDPFPQLDSIVYLDEIRRTLLERLMVKLGGTKRREPTQIMQVPNQPAGGTIDIRALWKRFFFVQPGHWGGWVFESYPIITEIEFVDAARTKAAVKVTVGYSGATVQMEKKDGVWVAKELTNFWIT